MKIFSTLMISIGIVSCSSVPEHRAIPSTYNKSYNSTPSSILKDCRTRNTLANTYKGLVTGMNLLLGATNDMGGVEGAKFGYRESSKQTKWFECD